MEVESQLPDTPSPLLLYGRKLTQTLYSISLHNPKASLKRIPQLRHKKILDHSHGWFVLRDWNECNMFSLYNPVTLHLINLPPLPAAPESVETMFFALKSPPDPDRDDSLFLCCNNRDHLLHWCSPAKPDCNWVTQPLEIDGVVRAAFTLHGLFYVFVPGENTNNGSFYKLQVDVPNSLITFTPWLQVSLPCYDMIAHKWLVESCSRVYFVCLFCVYPSMGLDLEPRCIKVFELDLSTSVWREIDTLDGRAFFLGWRSCTWCWPKNTEPESESESESRGGIQSNSIYFFVRNFSPEIDFLLSLYAYNLDDHSFMPLRSCPDIVMHIDAPVFWVTPQHQRLLSKKEGTKKVDSHSHHQVVLPQNNGGQLSRFPELPLHIIECISKYMHLFEYWNFRASCNLFRSVTLAPRWRTNNAPPMFLLFNNNNSGSGSCELIDPISCDSRFNTLPLLSPHPFTLQFSNNGWLLSLVDQQHFEFFNLFTGARGMLPLIDGYIYQNFRRIAFSSYPTNPDCLTVAIDASGDESSVHIHFLQSRYGFWRHRQFDNNQGIKFSVSNSSPVFLGGAFYFLDRQGFLGVFQVVNGAPSWEIYEKPQSIRLFHSSNLIRQFHSWNLVVCEGKLYSVFIEKVGKWIQLFRFDDLVKSWVEVKCLENHCLFISRASSFSVATRDHRMRNRIYLPRFGGNKLIYYSLNTRKFHVLGSDDPLVDLYGTSQPSTCCWI